MKISEKSFIIYYIVRFWNFVCRKYEESVLGSVVARLVACFRAGILWRFLTHDGPIGTTWGESRFYRAVQWCLALPARALARLGAHSPDGLFSRLCKRLCVPLLGAMLLLLLVIPQRYWNNLYSLVMVCGILILYYLSSLCGKMQRLALKDVGAWPVLLLLVVTLSWFWSESRTLGTRYLAFAFTCALLVLLVVSTADTEKKLRTILRLGAVGMAVCSICAVCQRLIGVAPNAALTDLALNPDMPGRVYSFFENPNSFANLLVFFAPLMLCLAIFSKKTLERLAFLAVFLLCALALVMTYSRGGWLALAFSVFVLMLFLCPRWVPFVALLCVAALPLLPANILNRLLSIFNFSDSSTYTRGYIYSAMGNLILRHPIFGVGIGADTLRQSVQQSGVYVAKSPFVHGHNLYLQLWAESGIFALVAFFGSLFVTMRKGRRALKTQSASPFLRGVVVGCISGLSGALLFGITDYAWSYPRIMVLFWFLFALLLAAIRIIEKEAGKNT
ncbi:MAG: O-antigen ligase family protein [Oscillospiraceae bacterium]|nr:O-antigen ligase family protein [Oscillospiraceae bacterium]